MSTGSACAGALPDAAITVAAYGPQMTRVAATAADEVVLNLVTPEHVARARAVVEEQARAQGRAPPGDRRLGVGRRWSRARRRCPSSPRRSPPTSRHPDTARASSSSASRSWCCSARAGTRRSELAAAVPVELLGALCAIGSRAQVLARLGEYRTAGATHIGVVPATAEDPRRRSCPRGPGERGVIELVAYTTAEARQQLLDALARATDEIGIALASLGEAYELLDEHTAEELEVRALLAPFRWPMAERSGPTPSSPTATGCRAALFEPAAPGAPSRGVKGLLEARRLRRPSGGWRAVGAAGFDAARGGRRCRAQSGPRGRAQADRRAAGASPRARAHAGSLGLGRPALAVAGSGCAPAPVGLRLGDRGGARRVHPPLGGQALDPRDVAGRPWLRARRAVKRCE